MFGVDMKRDVVERVVAWVAERLPFPVESYMTVERDEVSVDLKLDGLTMCGVEAVADANEFAARLARCAERRAVECSTSVDVAALLQQWWRVEAGYGMEDFRDASFSVEAVGEKLDAVREHVMAAVESGSEYYRNLLKLAEVLRGYREQVEAVTPAEFGQIMQGMVETAVLSENGTWFVETEDFVGEGAWHPEAWSEFLEDLDALRSRFGADMVDTLIAVVPGFDPTDEATWPADGIAATFYGDFLKLFDVSDMEA